MGSDRLDFFPYPSIRLDRDLCPFSSISILVNRDLSRTRSGFPPPPPLPTNHGSSPPRKSAGTRRPNPRWPRRSCRTDLLANQTRRWRSNKV